MADIEMIRDDDNERDEIEIALKPMNITTIHKREVVMTVKKHEKVGDFARTLLNIMQMKDTSPNQVNLLVLGKTLNHGATFGEQNVKEGAKVIFTLKRKLPQETTQVSKQQVQKEAADQALALKKPTPQGNFDQKSEEVKVVPPQPVFQERSFGVQPDGTFKSLLSEDNLEDLNKQSISILVEMGYNFDLVIKALRHLKSQPKYNPVGEVQKAMDWIDNYLDQQEMEQIQALQSRAKEQELAEQYTIEQATKASTLKLVKQKSKEKKKEEVVNNIELKVSAATLSGVWAWGNGLQGQIGVLEYQNYQPKPVIVPSLASINVQNIACGANHTVALSHEGRVYFWGQYVQPVKSNEPAKYGRVLQPKQHQSLANEYIIDIQAGSSHSLALNDQGQVFSWGYGLLGQLGINRRQNAVDAQRVEIDPKIKITKISAGVAHSSAISQTGHLLMWGSNQGCQLGYSKEIKQSLVPILFGGKISAEEEQKDQLSEGQSQEEMKVEEEQKSSITFDIGFRYQDVVCGSSQTLAIINQSPYLLEWGNGDPSARTHSDLFSNDRPIKYDVGSNNAVILTEKGVVYKLNLEKKTIDKIDDSSNGQHEGTELGILQLACGSDFIMALKSDGNVYGMGANKSGQLGLGDFKSRDSFTLLDTFLNQNVQKIFAGNQHCCLITETKPPMQSMIQEMRDANKEHQEMLDETMMKISSSDGKSVDVHKMIWQAMFGQNYSDVNLLRDQLLLMTELVYGVLSIETIYDWLEKQLDKLSVQDVLSNLQALKEWLSGAPLDQLSKQHLSGVLEALERRLNSMGQGIQQRGDLSEDQRQVISQLYMERNKILIQTQTISTEQRQRELNNQRDPAALTSFVYVRGMDFNEERRRLEMQNQRQQRPRRDQFMNLEYGEDEEM